MRVACSSEPEGRVYRFYRTSEDFSRAFRPLVPFLLACAVDIVIGGVVGDPKLLLRVGPIAGENEQTLLGLVGTRLVSPCDAEPAAL